MSSRVRAPDQDVSATPRGASSARRQAAYSWWPSAGSLQLEAFGWRLSAGRLRLADWASSPRTADLLVALSELRVAE